MKTLKSVLFFIECLDHGGAEKILTNIVKYLDKSKYNITVVSETDNEFHTEDIKAHANHRCFVRQKNNKSKIGRLINKLIIKFSLIAPPVLVRQLLIRGKYDIEIAFCEGYATRIIGSSKNKKSKKIAWVHTDVVNHPWSETVFGSKRRELQCYEKFDQIVCVSNTILDSFESKYGLTDKTQVLYNLIDYQSILKKATSSPQKANDSLPSFVLIGSFKKIKGYDRFIDVCHKLFNEGYTFNITIMGSGPEYQNISQKISLLRLGTQITLMQYQSNPYKHLSKSDALICCSYAEGYSSVVCESIILGIPVIATDCSGMKEIFGDKKCGIICPNSFDGLYQALKSVLDNPEILIEFSESAKQRSEYFRTEKRIKDIETLLYNL